MPTACSSLADTDLQPDEPFIPPVAARFPPYTSRIAAANCSTSSSTVPLGSVSPRHIVPLSSLSSSQSTSLSVSNMQPGQYVFVTSNPRGTSSSATSTTTPTTDVASSGSKQMIHVYMVSPPGTSHQSPPSDTQFAPLRLGSKQIPPITEVFGGSKDREWPWRSPSQPIAGDSTVPVPQDAAEVIQPIEDDAVIPVDAEVVICSTDNVGDVIVTRTKNTQASMEDCAKDKDSVEIPRGSDTECALEVSVDRCVNKDQISQVDGLYKQTFADDGDGDFQMDEDCTMTVSDIELKQKEHNLCKIVTPRKRHNSQREGSCRKISNVVGKSVGKNCLSGDCCVVRDNVRSERTSGEDVKEEIDHPVIDLTNESDGADSCEDVSKWTRTEIKKEEDSTEYVINAVMGNDGMVNYTVEQY